MIKEYFIMVLLALIPAATYSQDVPMGISVADIIPDQGAFFVASNKPGLLQLISQDAFYTYTFKGDKNNLEGVSHDIVIENMAPENIINAKLRMIVFIEKFTVGNQLPDKFNTINDLFNKCASYKGKNLFINDDSLGGKTLACSVNMDYLKKNGMLVMSLSVYILNP